MSAFSQAKSENGTQNHRDSLVFLVRAHSGFTKALADYSKGRVDSIASVWIDGPYGGINRPVERLYDTVILVAGGSGISACLPWLLHLSQASAASSSGRPLRVKRVLLVWAIRDYAHFSWIERDLKQITSISNNPLFIELKFHVTQATTSMRSSTKDIDEKEIMVAEVPISAGSTQLSRLENAREVLFGRPIMADVVNEHISEGKTMVLGCGPEGFRLDLANTCADVQRMVGKGGVQEVALYLEAFGW